EKEHLLPMIGTHPCARKVQATINSLSLVNFETNTYSVPTRYAGRKKAQLYAYVHHIEIRIDGDCVAKHERSYEKFQEIFEVDHYLDELERKPRAIQHARPVRRTKLPLCYQEFHKRTLSKYGHGKEFIKLLKLHREFTIETVERAVESCVKEQLFTADHVKHYLYLMTQPTTAKPVAIRYETEQAISVTPPAFSPYDQLIQKGRYLH
ncbi:IS21 family transposase, partial [Halalkalibacter sp. AB-rgal2]